MKPFYRFAHSVLNSIFSLFYSHKVYGIEHFFDENKPFNQGAIIAANHTSYLDPPLLGASWPYEISFLARKALFKVPLLSQIIKALNAHPIKGNRSNIGAIKTTGEIIVSGGQVVLFPEGERTFDGKLAQFKPGVGMIATKYECPIVPVYIFGAFEAWRRGQILPKPWGKTGCVFGSIIDTTPYLEMDRKEAQKIITELVHQKIQALKEWHDQGAQGTPP